MLEMDWRKGRGGRLMRATAYTRQGNYRRRNQACFKRDGSLDLVTNVDEGNATGEIQLSLPRIRVTTSRSFKLNPNGTWSIYPGPFSPLERSPSISSSRDVVSSHYYAQWVRE